MHSSAWLLLGILLGALAGTLSAQYGAYSGVGITALLGVVFIQIERAQR